VTPSQTWQISPQASGQDDQPETGRQSTLGFTEENNMSFRINTNVNAMNALRNLGSTGMEINKATTRLATGLRINSGADDPSGLIASESYRAQLSSMDQALRNNQDAMNFAKTAEGGLDEVNRLLRDARSLAVANGNGTLDDTQKQANQTQLNSIMSSIDRIAGNTAFGSKKLLNGTAGTQSSVIKSADVSKVSFTGQFNGAAIANDGAVDINVTTAGQRATALGTVAYATGATEVASAGSFTINGTQFTVSAGTTRDQLIQSINDKSSETGVTAEVGAGNVVSFSSIEYGADANVTVVDANGLLVTGGGSLTDSGVDAVADVTFDGTTVTFDGGTGLNLKDADGNSISLTAGGNVAGANTGVGYVKRGSSDFQIGANAGQTASLSLGNFSAGALGLNSTSTNITGTDMSTALGAIDSAIASVADSRGRIGSFMKNTLESNVRSLGIARENLAATESTIREIDVAAEMTNYTKLQILQQSGISMLAQANSGPQAVLSLLR
jgi:flagellin